MRSPDEYISTFSVLQLAMENPSRGLSVAGGNSIVYWTVSSKGSVILASSSVIENPSRSSRNFRSKTKKNQFHPPICGKVAKSGGRPHVEGAPRTITPSRLKPALGYPLMKCPPRSWSSISMEKVRVRLSYVRRSTFARQTAARKANWRRSQSRRASAFLIAMSEFKSDRDAAA